MDRGKAKPNRKTMIVCAMLIILSRKNIAPKYRPPFLEQFKCAIIFDTDRCSPILWDVLFIHFSSGYHIHISIKECVAWYLLRTYVRTKLFFRNAHLEYFKLSKYTLSENHTARTCCIVTRVVIEIRVLGCYKKIRVKIRRWPTSNCSAADG